MMNLWRRGGAAAAAPHSRRLPLAAPAVAGTPVPSLGPRDLVAAATWFGLVLGFVELGLCLILTRFATNVTMSSLRTNVHFAWMIPMADAAIFAALGLALVPIALRRPRVAQRILCLLLAGLVPLALLLRIEGLYTVARLVLALGFAAAAGPRLEAAAPALRRLTSSSLPILGGALVALIVADSYRIMTAERRGVAALPAPPRGAANVVLLVLDNVRAASMSLYGQGRPTTPRLERLAGGGIRFDRARATAPWTLPSHASMFTGRWHHELSVGWSAPLDATHPTLAEALASRGYATAGFVGNVYYCNRRYGLDRGFARYEDYYENQAVSAYEVLRSSGLGRALLPLVGRPVAVGDGEPYRRKTAASLNRDLLGWLDRRPADRPFFAFVNYYDAHAPCVVPEGAPRRFGHCRRPQKDLIEALKRFQRSVARSPRPGDGTPADVEREALEIFVDSYESCIAYVDDQVGRLMDELERRGLLHNTYVVVTSDHGEHFNEHGFMGHGQSLYRRELHVPLLIVPPRGAGAVRAAVVRDPVSLRDLAATIVDLAGIDPPSPFPGRSLAALWEPGADDPAPVLSEVGHKAHFPLMPAIPATRGAVKSIVTEGRVYIHNSDGTEELYNLSNDPLERANLAGVDALRPVLERCREALSNVIVNKD